jgi:putative oxidoreductase
MYIMLERFTKNYGDGFYVIFRILVGFMFFLHGGQKVFGWFGGPGGNGAVDLTSQFGLAGGIELIGGLFILLGLFTRVSALVSGIEMFVAYFKAHASGGVLLPLLNNGEPAALFFTSFLVIFAFGAKRWGLDLVLFGKRRS